MPFENAEMKKALLAIEGAIREGWTKDRIKTLMELARMRKHPDLDRVSVEMMRRYSGNQTQIIRRKLKRRFPKTEVEMPVAPLNITKLVARLDAGVYLGEPERPLETEAGERLAPDHEASKLWKGVLRKARWHSAMSEVERRALIAPCVALGQIVYVRPPGDKVGKPEVQLYAPSDCEVLCHWSAPTNWDMRFFVALKQAAPDMSSEGDWYRLWARLPSSDPDGKGTWGRWTSAIVSTEGKATKEGPPEEYKGEAQPVFQVQLHDPQGYVLGCHDADLIEVVDDINVRRSNESYVIDLQGHDQAWTDDINDVSEKKSGPDELWNVSPGRQVALLSPNPKLADMRESRKLAYRELAIARGNNPDAYATEPGPPLSGVAKRIANLTHEHRIAEQASLMQILEEDGPLAILIDVVRTFHPEGKKLNGLVPRMIPRKPPTIEDPAQRQQRLESAVKAKWITRAQAATEAEHYASLEEATRMIAVIDAEDDDKDDPPPDGEGGEREGEGLQP